MSIDWHDQRVLASVRAGANRGVMAWIGMVEEEAVRLITSGHKSGRVYVRRGVKHQASAPGEPPASDTGTLVNARKVDLLTDQLAARLTFTSKYAPHLQFGTRNMEPRPFADVALHNTLEKGQAVLRAEIAASLR